MDSNPRTPPQCQQRLVLCPVQSTSSPPYSDTSLCSTATGVCEVLRLVPSVSTLGSLPPAVLELPEGCSVTF